METDTEILAWSYYLIYPIIMIFVYIIIGFSWISLGTVLLAHMWGFWYIFIRKELRSETK